MKHEHAMYDSDTHFIIDGVKRTIKNADAVKMLLVQHDHNSERFTFELPRYIDGHDMMLCDSVQIHYINIGDGSNTSEDVYEVDDLSTSPAGDDVVIFSWLISGNATKYVGSLSFAIRFACLSADKSSVTYAWHTTPHTAVQILKNIYNTPAVSEDHSDIIAEWNERLTYLETWFDTLKSGNVPKIGWVTLLSDSWEGEDGGNLYKQVVTVEGVTANSQVDLTPSVEQLAVFYEKDITFVTENDDGVVTVYVIGQKPANDYTIQATITEVDI